MHTNTQFRKPFKNTVDSHKPTHPFILAFKTNVIAKLINNRWRALIPSFNRNHKRKVVEDPSIAQTRKTRKKKTDTRKRMKSFYFLGPYMLTRYSSSIFSLNALAVLESRVTRQRTLHIFASRILNCSLFQRLEINHRLIILKSNRDKPNKGHFQCGHHEALLQDSQYYPQSS